MLEAKKGGTKMKQWLTMAMVLGLSLLPLATYAQSEETETTPPPVAAALVREGDFAMKLADGLDLGTASDEAEAESMLTSAGIAPRNGWISDYPMTPDIIGEIENAVAVSADSNRLPMGKDDALRVLRTAAVELGLPIVVDIPGGYAEGPPPTSPEYTEPSAIDNYYYEEGPPVVTYYPPPWDYGYLYAWVPSPFWCGGFFFPGFFILRDFHKTVAFHGHTVLVSNHVFDRGHHRSFMVDPVRRRTGNAMRTVVGSSEGRRFTSADARRGAESISRRNHEGMMASRAPTERNLGTPRGQSTPFFNGRSGGRTPVAPRESFRGLPREAVRSFSAPAGNGSRSGSFRSPSMAERSYSGGFHGGSRAFSGRYAGGFHGGVFRGR